MTDIQTQIAAAQKAVEVAQASASAVASAYTQANAAFAAMMRAVREAGITADAAVAAVSMLKAEQITVNHFGAKGDGITDDARAFQAMADSGMPVVVPAGRYMIDPLKTIMLPARCSLVMDPDAVLIAIPNSSPKYSVIEAAGDDVTITGGQIIGDRGQHKYVDTGDRYRTHEHGYGLKITGNRVKVDGLKVSECTGDGIAVSGDDVEIVNSSAKHNRRNGISVFNAARPKIRDCDCSDNGFLTDTTGLPGPFAGIDIEPDAGDATGVKLERIKATGNQKVGIALWVRGEVQSNLQAEITDCEISGSPNCIWGADEGVRAPTIAASVLRCKLTFGSGAAIKAGRGSVFKVGDADPANANIIDSASGTQTTAVKYGLQARDGGVVVKGENRFV